MGSSKAVEKELLELFEKVKKAADKAITNEAEEQRCLDALKALRAVPVTMGVLVSTQVGKRLRNLTKHPQENICTLATDLLDSWKKVVTSETLANSGNKATQSEDKQSKSIKVEDNAVKRESVKVEKKPKEEEASITNKNVSSSSNGPPKLTSMIKCNDAVRDKIREIIYEAFSKVVNEAEGENMVRINACDPVRVAVTVETLMFEKLGRSNGAQKLKYRSIIFNLKDANNPDLRRRVLLGEIKPEKLIVMTAEEMASDQRKLENKQIKDKALFECERGIKPKATTDQFKCGKCGQRKCTYYQLQTRSADEPMTTFVTCVNCNNHWKFC
uniref:Transcription elongation factor n=1 Tax=Picea sitchensis TaxID=3332 RepID=C0PT74_PICSI|nr:unknown [Picea sitchensis]